MPSVSFDHATNFPPVNKSVVVQVSFAVRINDHKRVDHTGLVVLSVLGRVVGRPERWTEVRLDRGHVSTRVGYGSNVHYLKD